MKTHDVVYGRSVGCGIVTSRKHLLWRHLTDCPQNFSKWVTCVFPPSSSWLSLNNYRVRFTAFSLASMWESIFLFYHYSTLWFVPIWTRPGKQCHYQVRWMHGYVPRQVVTICRIWANRNKISLDWQYNLKHIQLLISLAYAEENIQ